MADVPDYEEEATDKPQARNTGKLVGSEEYVEAAQGIQSDPYDYVSWLSLCEEVCNNRGGSATVTETYQKFLHQFPRSVRVWQDFASWHEKQGDFKASEELLESAVEDVRSVKLWLHYLKTVAQLSMGSDANKDASAADLGKGRRRVESIFEKAVESVGTAYDSAPLWKAYLDFVKDWPGSAGMDPQKKISALKHIYVRAVQVPQEAVDVMWEEFSTFEKTSWASIGGAAAAHADSGERGGEALLQDLEFKCTNSKAIYKIRARLNARIDTQRFAIPPSRSSKDTEQLELWNTLIRYEKSLHAHWDSPVEAGIRAAPSDRTGEPSLFHNNITMLYEQCLNFFRLHPEVWLAYGSYALSTGDVYSAENAPAANAATGLSADAGSELASAREVYTRSLEAIPTSSLLRLAYAEAEEVNGSMTAATRQYKEAFTKLPSAATFSAYQRHLRRTVGMLAARRLFTEAIHERNDKKHGFHIYMSHARMELYSNSDPEVCVKVLDMCRQVYPIACDSVVFVRLLVQALQQTGNLQRIQWCFTTVLGNGGTALVPHVAQSTEAVGVGGHARSSEEPLPGGAVAAAAANNLSLEDTLILWELYYTTESVMGHCSLARLKSIRESRDTALLAVDTKRKASTIVGSTASAATSSSVSTAVPPNISGLFDSAHELVARHTMFSTTTLSGPASSSAATSAAFACPAGYGGIVSTRCNNMSLNLPDVDNGAYERSLGRSVLGENSRSEILLQGSSNLGNTNTTTTGVPTVLSNLISRLPPHVGPEPNFDMFLRHLKSTTLPPRPLVEEERDLSSNIGAKRTIPGAEWLSGMSAAGNADGDDIDYEMNEAAHSSRDDVFRQRQRARRS